MTVGSQALERSTLEAKDRDSLQKIAEALGGKPGARAKKADIVTMILDLAGVSRDEPSDAGGQLALGETAAAGDEAATPEAETRSANGNGRSADEPASAAGAAGDETGAPEEAGAATEAPEQAGAPARPPSQQPRGDEGDQSTRRRRRRGRDRERQAPSGGSAGAGAQPAPDEFQGEPVEVSGLLDLRDEGYGFLRVTAYVPSKEDVYVSVKQVRQFGLRKGDVLTGAARPASRNEKNPALLRIDEVNGKEPELNRQRERYEDLTPLDPDVRLALDDPGDGDASLRVLDLVAPIGKGARGLIVAPPGAGKTSLLKRIGVAAEAADPDVAVMALLIDARPEEVTDLERSLRGTVVASTFDRPADEHVMVSDLLVERAKRLVEEGRDVVVLLDGLTRLARAHHMVAAPTGRTVADGVDASAVGPVKRILGSARNIEDGGSLTILATANVGTGFSLDEVVVGELAGAGNLEVRLDRQAARRRHYPAVDPVSSTTFQEAQLVGADSVEGRRRLRRELAEIAERENPSAAIEALLARIGSTASNDDLLAGIGGAGD